MAFIVALFRVSLQTLGSIPLICTTFREIRRVQLLNLRFSATGAVLRARAWLTPTTLPNLLDPVVNVVRRRCNFGSSMLWVSTVAVIRTVAGKALPDDRFTPMRLPGRMGPPDFTLLFRTLTVWPETILPVPTPARAFELAR